MFNFSFNFISGYDGHVRVWSGQSTSARLEHVLVFQKAENVFGNELSGELISNLCWSSNGHYIAATINCCLNIWTLSSSECYIEDHSSIITAVAWPKIWKSKYGDEDHIMQYLLVGKSDGTVSLVRIRSKAEFSREDLTNCAEQCMYCKIVCAF
jgi:WD40 repeat protein